MSMIVTSNIPISAMNLRSERKYHGRMPINITVAVNMMAFPVVVSAAVKVFGKSPLLTEYSSQILEVCFTNDVTGEVLDSIMISSSDRDTPVLTVPIVAEDKAIKRTGEQF